MRRAAVALVAACLVLLAAVASPAAPVTHHKTAAHHHKVKCVPARHHRATRRPMCHTKKAKPKVTRPAPKPAPTPIPTPLVGPAPVVGTPSTAPTPPPPPAPTAALPSRLGVDEQEYSVYPTHNPVATGSVEFNVSNFGQDDHNLTIARDGVVLAGTAVVHPGEQQAVTVDLAPGTYKLYCSLYDHEQLGMVATLVVQ